MRIRSLTAWQLDTAVTLFSERSPPRIFAVPAPLPGTPEKNVRHNNSSTWREHYATTVRNLNSCDQRLSRALGHAELAIANRLQEIQHSPAHAREIAELAKATDGLLLIKTAVLGYPEFKHHAHTTQPQP